MEGLLPELEVIRKDFPILERTLAGGLPLVYLDSANTSQKPQVVIDTMVDHLERHNANVARAMHQLGAESTEAFEAARDKVAAFINAPVARRGDLHQERLRGAQPGRQHAGLGTRCRWRSARATRSSSPRWSTTPTSCRGSCSPSARARAALVRAHRRRPARPVEHRPADQRAHQGRLADLGLQHARHHQPGRRDRPPRPRGRRDRRRRRLAGRARSCRRRRRPPVPTCWPSPATRWSARPASACSGASASSSTSCRRSSVAAR